MALKKKPVTGMKDILPAEMQIRDYVLSQIKETYRSFGFSAIETPCVEHIENLLSKQGGDNEKLIFKVLKRGEKLNLETAETENDLTDSGLRYDLTLPLSRYYSNNAAALSAPFKALQICPDHKFEVRINDRKILRAMAVYSGFPEEDIDKVFITVDKMDKIGTDGVKAELVENGYSEAMADKYLELMGQVTADAACVRKMGELLSGIHEDGAAENLAQIMDTVAEVSTGEFGLLFDPTLVRGMGYYTGTIFEVSMEGFGGSVAGGGRYDKMIGKFTGMDTPACGFSIGFERIVTILLDAGFVVPSSKGKEAWLFEKGTGMARLAAIMKEAMAARAEGKEILLTQMNKNKKFQKDQLGKEGYTEFKEFYKEDLKH